MLITLCNKRLDSLDLKILEYEGKGKEPPGFELDSAKKIESQRWQYLDLSLLLCLARGVKR